MPWVVALEHWRCPQTDVALWHGELKDRGQHGGACVRVEICVRVDVCIRW